MSSYKIQGRYYDGKWLRENLFKITPATYPAKVTLTVAYDDTNLHVPSGWTYNVKYSYDGITWSNLINCTGSDFVHDETITINKPIYLMNCSTDDAGNSVWQFFSEGGYLRCNQNYTVSGKFRYFFQDGKWPIKRIRRQDNSDIYRGKFNNLFRGSTTLTDASGLDMWFDEFAATNPDPVELKEAYRYMFQGCTSLVYPPATIYVPLNLGALKTAQSYNIPSLDNLCSEMFEDCTSLVSAPELPCMYVGNNIYSLMFKNCSSLVTPPLLPANDNLRWRIQSLSDEYAGYTDCYSNMFYGCTSLTSVPQVNFTKFNNDACGLMFAKCGIKFSDTQSAETPYAYRVPASGTGTYYYEEAEQELPFPGAYPTNEMFINEGDASYSKTPTLNTTYYISLPIRQQ